jgi:hypothetical protein
MREAHGPRDDYVARAERAADAELPIVDIALVYEDDGYYEFAVRLEAPADPDYADLVFVPRGDVSAIACATDEHTMRMAVIVAPFSEFAKITGRGCDPPDASSSA